METPSKEQYEKLVKRLLSAEKAIFLYGRGHSNLCSGCELWMDSEVTSECYQCGKAYCQPCLKESGDLKKGCYHCDPIYYCEDCIEEYETKECEECGNVIL